MVADALLATAHYLTVFFLIAVLAGELVLLRAPLDAASIRKLALTDRLYGLAAILVIAAGVSRVYFGLKDESFYWGLHTFWTKVGLFVIVGILSAWPTMRMLSWARAVKANASFTPPAGEVKAVKRLVHVQAGLVLLIIICATLMARGVG